MAPVHLHRFAHATRVRTRTELVSIGTYLPTVVMADLFFLAVGTVIIVVTDAVTVLALPAGTSPQNPLST